MILKWKNSLKPPAVNLIVFLEGMIKHHEGAIEMAQMVLDSDNAEAAKLGKEIVRTQQAEINQMQDLLNR